MMWGRLLGVIGFGRVWGWDLYVRVDLEDGSRMWTRSEIYSTEREALRGMDAARRAGFVGAAVVRHGDRPEL